MRHRKGGNKLNWDSSERRAALRNMVTSLVLHGQVLTTEARAKELRRFTEKVITIAKNAPSTTSIASLPETDAQSARARRVHAIRMAKRWVHDDVAMQRLFGEYVERFAGRPGGYTRIVKAGLRQGDRAPMAVIEIVGTSQPVAAPVAETAEG